MELKAIESMETTETTETTKGGPGLIDRIRDMMQDYVKLDTISYDEDACVYRRSRQKVLRQDLPEGALKVNGSKKHYCVDNVHGSTPDAEPVRASTFYLYMMNNDLNDALTSRWSQPMNIDWKTMLVVGGALVLALYILIQGGILA